MEELRPGLGEQHGLRGGIVAIDGGARHIAFGEAHDLPALEVDGGKDDHHPTRQHRPAPPARTGLPLQGKPGRSSQFFMASTSSRGHRPGSFRDGTARRPHCRAPPPRPAAAMIGHRRDVMAVVGHEVIGMQEIGLARLDQPATRRAAAGLHVVPAHVRDLDRGIGPLDQPHLAADPAQPGVMPCSSPRLASSCMPDADAEERRAAHQHPFFHRLDQCGIARSPSAQARKRRRRAGRCGRPRAPRRDRR
jgi:hypothetical protein